MILAMSPYLKTCASVVIAAVCIWAVRGSFSVEQQPAQSETSSHSQWADLSLDKQQFNDVTPVPSDTYYYGGSTTWAPIRRDVDSQLFAAVPTFRLKYRDPKPGSGETPGSGTGIRMLLDGELNFSQSSRPVKDKEQAKARLQGFNLRQIPVALDGIAIAVHPSLAIDGLTLEQLRRIYTGQINNWQAVGGPNLAIVPYSRRQEDGGTVEFFLEEVIEGSFGNNVQFARDTTDGLRKAGRDLGGIYYGSAPEVVGQCTVKPLALGEKTGQWVAPYTLPYIPQKDCPRYRNRLNSQAFQEGTYPITRELYVIVKEGSDLETAGKAYAELLLTEEDQKFIEKAGFVRIRD
ncbi:MAG: PstS family phosphate ABC transporter substrate-binding protein [Chloroflexaceae bacterium]|nr:PstS family phosphate ABC transporter substrate-binding protein [Chloroflexaceae bacterium]